MVALFLDPISGPTVSPWIPTSTGERFASPKGLQGRSVHHVDLLLQRKDASHPPRPPSPQLQKVRRRDCDKVKHQFFMLILPTQILDTNDGVAYDTDIEYR